MSSLSPLQAFFVKYSIGLLIAACVLAVLATAVLTWQAWPILKRQWGKLMIWFRRRFEVEGMCLLIDIDHYFNCSFL
jgi:intracellular septation protein A